MKRLNIIPECYVDTCLAETITFCELNHTKGCGTVVKKMKEKFNDKFAVGIIDKDKKEIPYLQEFDLITSNDSLFLYKHRVGHHYIIQISPAIESFFLNAANEIGVDITAEYGLPSDMKKLTKITKQVSGKDGKSFRILKQLFKNISNATELRRLSELIIYLDDHAYQVEVEELKRIINE